MHLRDFAAQDLGHGTLVVGHDAAVRPEHLERAAKPLVGIPQRRLAAPQMRGVTVEFLNHARDIAGINGHGTQVEQGAIAFFSHAQRRLRLLALGGLPPRLVVQVLRVLGELVLAHRTEDQGLTGGAVPIASWNGSVVAHGIVSAGDLRRSYKPIHPSAPPGTVLRVARGTTLKNGIRAQRRLRRGNSPAIPSPGLRLEFRQAR